MCIMHLQEAAAAMAGSADKSAAELMLDLSAARHVGLSKTSLLLLLKSGQMVAAHLTIEAGMVKHIKVTFFIGYASSGYKLLCTAFCAAMFCCKH